MSDEVRVSKLNTLLKTFGTGSRITECSDGPGYTLWEWERHANGGTEYPATYENIEELEANVQRVIRSTQKFKSRDK